jgi:hypothetical protein
LLVIEVVLVGQLVAQVLVIVIVLILPHIVIITVEKLLLLIVEKNGRRLGMNLKAYVGKGGKNQILVVHHEIKNLKLLLYNERKYGLREF